MDEQTSKTLDYGVYYMEPEETTPQPLRQRVAELEKQVQDLQNKVKEQEWFINSHRGWLLMINQLTSNHWKYIKLLEEDILKLRTK